ncbi:MAG TPA: alpha-2-macroglobulin, partial [Blastocatellia bacterium]|nr:alpha-2-macroglobulin [Blastocatellia bacterium]
AAITAKTLKDLGLDPKAISGKMFGGVEPATASATHPGVVKGFEKLDSAVNQGLERLYGFQHDDGGWGWWKEDHSDHYMTAYVIWGLSLARGAGITVDDSRLEKGVEYLDKELVNEEPNYDEQAWMLHALSVYHAVNGGTSAGEFQSKAFQNLWENRDKLNAYTRALLALAAHNYGYQDRARTLVENLENGAVIDSAPDRSVIQIGPASSTASVIGTAHWGEDGVYWRWSEGGIESTAFALRAMLAIDPKNRLIEPVTNWLIKNRRGAQWSNTRDTAICVLTLDDYLRQSGELQPDTGYELAVNGHTIADHKFSAADALSAPSHFDVPAEFIKNGANEIRITRKSGNSPIYFAASARFFSLEEPVTAAGNEIFARRDYYRLVPHPTLLKGFVYERQPLRDGDTVNSGDRIETVVTIESKNNYEYLMFEDLKPAGFEAVGVRSDSPLYARQIRADAIKRKYEEGAEQPAVSSVRTKAVVGAGDEVDNGGYYDSGSEEESDSTGRMAQVHQELRDRKVAMFIGQLPQGVWEIRYDMRAEVPGSFHALPVTGQAMYVPEIRCNGAETRVKVAEAGSK